MIKITETKKTESLKIESSNIDFTIIFDSDGSIEDIIIHRQEKSEDGIFDTIDCNSLDSFVSCKEETFNESVEILRKIREIIFQ